MLPSCSAGIQKWFILLCGHFKEKLKKKTQDGNASSEWENEKNEQEQVEDTGDAAKENQST